MRGLHLGDREGTYCWTLLICTSTSVRFSPRGASCVNSDVTAYSSVADLILDVVTGIYIHRPRLYEGYPLAVAAEVESQSRRLVDRLHR